MASGARSAPVADPADVALLRMLEQSGALRRGHFLLSSGLHSPAYVQCALLLQDPRWARRIGKQLAARLAPHGPQSVLSPALGGVVIGHEVASALGIPFRFTEREAGAMALRRGFAFGPGERVAVVEDVVTTGRSTRETAELAARQGAVVVAIGSILDRSGGAPGFTVPFVSLLSLDLPTHSAADCPLCRAGGRPEKPGSRPPAPGA
jgi:orotate phosphoribosyltransferase